MVVKLGALAPGAATAPEDESPAKFSQGALLAMEQQQYLTLDLLIVKIDYIRISKM